MSDTPATFDQLADAARRTLARGDREAARVSLTAALQASDATAARAAESADGLLRLGALCQDAGLNTEAERFFLDAVTAAERAHGDEDWSVVPALASLGTALAARGASAEAEPLLTRALSISERHLGDGHQDLNVLLNALSRLYLKQGAFARAEPLLERLLALKLNKGEDHPEVATVLASLAAVRQGLGDHEGAEQLARRVLQIRESTLAPNHFAIASALELLAESCSARGNFGEALLLYERALSIREQTLGIGHASLRVLRERIADLQLQGTEAALGDADGATAMLSYPSHSSSSSGAAKMPAAVHTIATASSIPGVALTPRNGTGHEAVRRALAREATSVFAERADAHLQQALVVPAATGVLSLQDELRDIERDFEDEAAATRQPSPLRAAAAALWAAVLHRRMQAAIIGAGALTLLVAAVVVQPRAPERARDDAARVDAEAPGPRSGSVAGPASFANDTTARVVNTSLGSLGADAASDGVATHLAVPARSQRQSGDDLPAREPERAASLLLRANLHPPVANVLVPRADSIARVSASAPKIANDGFSKQFWRKALDTTPSAAAVGEPTRAKLRGTMPQPVYPEILRKNGVEGEVAVQFVVDESGRPDLASLEVLHSPHDAMTDAVRKVVAQMRFDPALTGGPTPKPRSEVVRVSYMFIAAPK